MQIGRSLVTFPVVLTVKGKKALGIFKVLTSCLLCLHEYCWILCRFHLPFSNTPSTVWSWFLNKQFTKQAPVIPHQWKLMCLQHESSSAVSVFLLKLWFSALFHLTVPSLSGKGLTGAFMVILRVNCLYFLFKGTKSRLTGLGRRF